ncbi:hypothetical protein AB0P36_33910 [Streptomyces flavidovirens]|uniref:hypothetical protein n=1 Tax=Streptomyces flavidovirens TaxID=67298 RepID=UPI00343640C0
MKARAAGRSASQAGLSSIHSPVVQRAVPVQQKVSGAAKVLAGSAAAKLPSHPAAVRRTRAEPVAERDGTVMVQVGGKLSAVRLGSTV